MAQVIALIGFMGAGKTSVGAEVARQLGWHFIDLDREFEKAHPEGIARFFADRGEEAFRREEVSILRRVLERCQSSTDSTGVVLAAGGGIVQTSEAVEILRRQSVVICLAVDAATAWSRSRDTGRPLAQDAVGFRALFEQRLDLYEAAADWILPASERSIAELAGDILSIVGMIGAQSGCLWGRYLRSTNRACTIVGGQGSLYLLRERACHHHEADRRIFLITDQNVYWAWGYTLGLLLGHRESDDVVIVPPGEQSKSVDTLARLWGWLATQRARRDDLVIAAGGGVIGDLGGLVASTYQRGVPLWQVPTTLLAQVDSSVGGKTAINLEFGKNLVGTFYQPDLVVIDPLTLATLPDSVYRSALGEVVKYGLLLSHSFLVYLERNAEQVLGRRPEVLADVTRRCVFFKARIVEEDEREDGKRAVLNLGHTTAHALERVLGYGNISHGQAVALGLLVTLAMSERLLGADRGIRERVTDLLRKLGLPTTIRLPDKRTIWEAVSRDKKARARSAGFVGLEAVGSPVLGLDMSPALFEEALEVLAE